MKNFLMVIMLACMFACTAGKKSVTVDANALKGEWVMVDFKGQETEKLEEIPPVPLHFFEGENRFQVKPFNSVSGGYEVNGPEIKFLMGPSTMMAQPPEEMIFLNNFYKVNHFEIVKGQLILKNEADQVKMTFKKKG